MQNKHRAHVSLFYVIDAKTIIIFLIGIPENRDRDPSGTLTGPYKNRKTGTLAGPYKNRKTRTLAGPYKNLKTGTLVRPYKNRKTGTLVEP